MNNLFDLSSKVALVTGSSKGIGRAIIERMAEHGARVVVSSRKADLCDEVAAAINEKHQTEVAVAIPCNISHKEELQQLVAKTREKWRPHRHPGVQCRSQPVLRFFGRYTG